MLYKLVRKEDYGLCSWSTFGEYEVQYVPGKFVKGKHPLFLFRDFDEALSYYNSHYPYEAELWEVETINERPFTYIYMGTSNIDMFWHRFIENIDKPRPSSWYIADQVKLVKKIEL